MDKKEENGKKEINLLFEKKFAFDVWDDAQKKAAFDFCEGYKKFLDDSKTERLAVKFAEKTAVAAGFKKLEHIGQSGRKGFSEPLYSVNRGKAIILARPGKHPVSDGVRMILAHIDVSRFDLKMKPLYENDHIAFLKTQYYGAPKKYQWTALPLAMYGMIAKQDGTVIDVALGDGDGDPIFIITDIAPHLDKFQAKEKIDEAIPARTLNLVVGSTAAKGKEGEKDLVKKNVLQILHQKYGICEEDFVSADLEFVPQGKARDIGFDRSLIAGYGHDDRACSFAALEALISSQDSEYATIVILSDKEETGSNSVSGVQSNFIIDFVSELIYLETGVHDENVLRDVFFKSKAVSADTTFGFDPDYPESFDAGNTPKIGGGVAMEKYTGVRGKYFTSEASGEFTAQIRHLLNSKEIIWQSSGGIDFDMGGGGTMAMYLARLNMDVIDLSIPLLSTHAPFEIASKADIYSAYLAYKAFFESK